MSTIALAGEELLETQKANSSSTQFFTTFPVWEASGLSGYGQNRN